MGPEPDAGWRDAEGSQRFVRASTPTVEYARRSSQLSQREGQVEEEIVGARAEVALPSVEFGPGLVALRRCDGCGCLDRRTWYVTPGQAIEHDARRSITWR